MRSFCSLWAKQCHSASRSSRIPHRTENWSCETSAPQEYGHAGRETLLSGHPPPTCSPRGNCSYRGRHPASASGAGAPGTGRTAAARAPRGAPAARPLHRTPAWVTAAWVAVSGDVCLIKKAISTAEMSIFRNIPKCLLVRRINV